MDTIITILRFSDESLTMVNSVDSFCKSDYKNALYFINKVRNYVVAYKIICYLKLK